MATKKSSPKSPECPSTRPPLELPFEVPESIRVDPCTAMAEWLKTLHPDAPAPVFSTKALMHGHEAVGAKRIRPGFSFNPQMDLLWALGFPEVVLIVDGLPVPDSVEGLLNMYRVEARMAHDESKKWSTAQSLTGRIYTRRGAWARLFELSPVKEDVSDEERHEYALTIFELDDDADRLTLPQEQTRFDLRNIVIWGCKQMRPLQDVLLMEALFGPDLAVDVLLELLEEGHEATTPFDIFGCLQPLALRLNDKGHAALVARVSAWKSGYKGPNPEYADCIIDPLGNAKRELANDGNMMAYRGYLGREWEEEITLDAEKKPFLTSNDVFVGDSERVFRVLLASLPNFETLDKDEAFLESLSSVASPLTLVPLLGMATAKHSRALARAWFDAHRVWASPHLHALAQGSDKKTAKLAAQELERL